MNRATKQRMFSYSWTTTGTKRSPLNWGQQASCLHPQKNHPPPLCPIRSQIQALQQYSICPIHVLRTQHRVSEECSMPCSTTGQEALLMVTTISKVKINPKSIVTEAFNPLPYNTRIQELIETTEPTTAKSSFFTAPILKNKASGF